MRGAISLQDFIDYYVHIGYSTESFNINNISGLLGNLSTPCKWDFAIEKLTYYLKLYESEERNSNYSLP